MTRGVLPLANRRRRVVVGLLVGAVFLALAFRRIVAKELVRELADFNPWWFPLFVATHLLSLWIRSWRWQAIVNPIRTVGLKVLFPITVRGFLITNILPMKAGDLYRFFALGQKTELGGATAMGTLVVERLFDLLGLALVSLFLALVVPLPGAFVKALKWMGIAALGAGALWLAYRRLPRLKKALGDRGLGIGPWAEGSYVGRIVENLRQGFAALRDFRQWLALLALTSLMFAAYYAGVLVIIRGFGIRGLSPLAPLALMAFVFWVGLLPQAPAGVGTFEYASMLALQLFGVGREEALAVALVMHAAVLVNLLVFNGVILLTQNRALRGAPSLGSDLPANAEGSDS